LMPMLTELTMTPEGELNPAALQRLSTMEQMLRRSGETIFDKKLKAQLRAKPETPEEREAIAILKDFTSGKTDIGQFTDRYSVWRDKNTYKMPSSVRTKPAPVKTTGQSIVDSYLSGP